jgi:hypothetical protein
MSDTLTRFNRRLTTIRLPNGFVKHCSGLLPITPPAAAPHPSNSLHTSTLMHALQARCDACESATSRCLTS